MANLVVTIDGPAASGKSTAARLLARKLNAAFLDTGAMYRAVTLAAMQAGAEMADSRRLTAVLEQNRFEFEPAGEQMKVSVNGADVTERIRQDDVTGNARYIACASEIRERLVQMQRAFARGCETVVTEGRDQGTVAFPDAEVKFFLTAELAERARRRAAELRAKGLDARLEQVRQAIEDRDKSDSGRAVGPLKPANDAIVIDTTNMTIDQVVEKLFDCTRQKCFRRH